MKKKTLILLLLLSSYISCNKFLNLVPDDIESIRDAFTSRYEAEGFLHGCYSYVPNLTQAKSNPGLLGGGEIWFNQPSDYDSETRGFLTGGFNSTDPYANYWGGTNEGKFLYRGLTDCNIFLNNIHMPKDIDEMERRQWIAEVQVLKAFYHYYLMIHYGPIPLARTQISVGASSSTAQQHRDPLEDVVDYIVELVDEAMPDLLSQIDNPAQDMGRVTKPIAAAIKAQALIWAASPLFNGNSDYADIKDNRGINLFPTSHDPEKWTIASKALKEAIDLADAAGHRLYKFEEDESILAGELYELTVLGMNTRGAVTSPFNVEQIWGDSNTNPEELQNAAHPYLQVSDLGASARGSYAPTLNIVEKFYTKNGLPIEADLDWVGVDPYGMRTSDLNQAEYMASNHNTVNMHFDREPRFYGNIMFDGGKYFGAGRISNDKNMFVTHFQIKKNVGGYQHTSHSASGYLVKKLINFNTTSGDNETFSASRYSWPIIRLADLYLLYAEALNEAEGPTSTVHQYVNKVRERSGLPTVDDSWKNYSNDPSKPNTKEGMREIIRREREIELCFEGKRFYDLRRWKEAENVLGKPIRGWNITAETEEDFYNQQILFEATFDKRQNLWPIKLSDMLRNHNLVQNLDWN